MKKHILSLMAAVSLLTGCYDLDRTPYDQVSSRQCGKRQTNASKD